MRKYILLLLLRAIKYKKHAMTPLSKRKEGLYREAKQCHICRKEFEENENVGDRKVRDHCHYNIKVPLIVNVANIRYQNYIPNCPIVFHNLSNYDAHLFIGEY